MPNFSGVNSDDVLRQVQEDERAYADLTTALNQAEGIVATIREKLHQIARRMFLARRALAGRATGDHPDGDRASDLDAVDAAMTGGTILTVTADATTGHGTVVIADPQNCNWHITFSADVAVYRCDSYELIPNDDVMGATVLSALWDDTWLIEARKDERDFHIRMSGDPIRVVQES